MEIRFGLPESTSEETRALFDGDKLASVGIEYEHYVEDGMRKTRIPDGAAATYLDADGNIIAWRRVSS